MQESTASCSGKGSTFTSLPSFQSALTSSIPGLPLCYLSGQSSSPFHTVEVGLSIMTAHCIEKVRQHCHADPTPALAHGRHHPPLTRSGIKPFHRGNGIPTAPPAHWKYMIELPLHKQAHILQTHQQLYRSGSPLRSQVMLAKGKAHDTHLQRGLPRS